MNTPESRTRDLEEKKYGLLAKSFVLKYLPEGSYQTLVTVKDKAGKFGRVLGKFVVELGDNAVAPSSPLDLAFLNDLLVQTHNAVAYHGQSKEDISEFGKPAKSPDLNSVINSYENSSKPIIAALHGTPLGGGLEVAMGCHYRVANSKTMLGLPEVKLGLLPGAGGTQRLPRIVGPELALEMITSGNPIPASKALKEGLIEEMHDVNSLEELIEKAMAFAKTIISQNSHPKSRDRNEKISNISNEIFKGKFKSSKKLVLEEFLKGEEASYFVIVDKNNFKFFGTAQDHKKVFELS